MQLSSDGIVLRSFNYEENRILTVLTRQVGVVTAFANHANRPRSAFAATTELLCYSDFRLFQSKERYIVDEADSLRIFFGIRSTFEHFALASYWAELFAELSPQGENSADYLHLLLGCLHYLEKKTRPVAQLKAIAELRLLTLAGYMPNLVGCGLCGEFEGDAMFFSLQGNLVCGGCKAKAEEMLWYPVSPGVLAAMRHITYADPRKIYSFTLSSDGFAQLGRLCEDYLLYHLEKTLPTLEFYRSLDWVPAPNDTVPNGTVSDSAVPDSAVPNGTMPSDPLSDNSTP